MSNSSIHTQQPAAKGPMTTRATGDLNALNVPFDADRTRPWSYALLDVCGAPTTFALALLLPCVAYGRNVSRREHLDRTGQPHPSGGAVGGDCAVHAACCALATPCVGPSCLLIESRQQSRTRYAIGGGGCADDCAAPVCCAPCALAQEARELALEERSFFA